MKFRPCIDLHQGTVKQIVGSTLNDESSGGLVTNFSSDRSPSWFAELYRAHNLDGGHIIKLGPGNDDAAREALACWPGGMQIGGGINSDNAEDWLEAGAAAVIVTSYIFKDGLIREDRLERLAKMIGKDRLVLDLSCRKWKSSYRIVTDRWQKYTDVEVTSESLDYFSGYCSEFLIHAVDVEGKCRGVELDLLKILGRWEGIPITYAGGIHSWDDIMQIESVGQGRVDFTVGSALDIFGGSGLVFDDLIDRLQHR